MLKFLKWTLSALLSFSLAFAAITPGQLDQQLQNALQTYLKQNQRTLNISAVQLSVLLPGQSEARNYVVGTQYNNQPIPATTGMLLQYGSITKEYTDAIVLYLAQQRNLPLTDTLLQLFPEEFTSNNANSWPATWQNVTLIQLMNMTSGIPNYTAYIAPAATNQEYSLEDLVNAAVIYQQKHGCSAAIGCFPAGSSWYYSNTNYIILGMFVEKFSGMSFTDAINTLLAPFQTQNNAVYYYAGLYPANILANMVHGYYFNSTIHAPITPIDVTDWNMSWGASAGAMIGNMNALTHIIYALYNNQLHYNGQLIPTQSFIDNAAQVLNGQPVTNIDTQCSVAKTNGSGCYGKGIEFEYDDVWGNGLLFLYEGGTLGYNTVYIWLPNEKVVLALSENSSNDDGQMIKLLITVVNPIIRQYLLSQ